MTQPIPWNGDPACGHDVMFGYQTHYCTYIRVPRLLLLQKPRRPDDLLLITAFQWYELWFKVLLTDLRAALAADPATYEPVKLLRRGLELFKLFDQQADLCETAILTQPDLIQPLAGVRVGGRPPSQQWSQLLALSRQLPRLGAQPALGLAVAVGLPAAVGLAAAVDEYQRRLKRFNARFRHFCRGSLAPAAGPAPTYADWLCLSDLHDLQQAVKSDWTAAGQAPTGFYVPAQVSADENLFVIVHQAFELWFKVMLDHLDRAVAALQADDIATASLLAGRVAAIQRLLVPQIQIPATMLAPDFMRFRSQTLERDGQALHTGLTPASGTESYQFREIEIVSGLRDDPVFRTYLAGLDSLPVRLLTPRQRQRLAEPTLPEVFRAAATRRGVSGFAELFIVSSLPNPHLDLAVLADSLLEFDEFFRFWRIGHVSMVEKMIGHRSGTGFLGPEYLAETAGLRDQTHNRVFNERQTRPRFFEELWLAREGGKSSE
jgi:tryptophan 2,3-dioxygenase